MVYSFPGHIYLIRYVAGKVAYKRHTVQLHFDGAFSLLTGIMKYCYNKAFIVIHITKALKNIDCYDKRIVDVRTGFYCNFLEMSHS